jgi:hypothetical protein
MAFGGHLGGALPQTEYIGLFLPRFHDSLGGFQNFGLILWLYGLKILVAGREGAIRANRNGIKIRILALVNIPEIGHLLLDPDDVGTHTGGLKFRIAKGTF